jgi:hypothetical protein
LQRSASCAFLISGSFGSPSIPASLHPCRSICRRASRREPCRWKFLPTPSLRPCPCRRPLPIGPSTRSGSRS